MKRYVTFLLAWVFFVSQVHNSALAISEGKRVLLFGGANWVLSADGIRATVDLNCRTNQGYNQGITGPISSFVTVSRAAPTLAYADDLAGNWIGFAPNTLRQTNKGCPVEEARTNSIPNSSNSGATVGTPGAFPTNWGQTGTCGITANIVGVGTESGIDYIDVQWNGTTGAGVICNVDFDTTTTAIAAVYGQTWSESVFYKLVGGSLTNVAAINLIILEMNGGGSQINASTVPQTNPTSAALGTQRAKMAYTLPDATAGFVYSRFQVQASGAGVAINVTLRIGWPQLELNPNVLAQVATGAKTIVANGTSGCTGNSGTLSGGSGANPATTFNVTTSGGVVTAVSTNVQGAYTALPASPATITGITGCTGPVTVTLTAADNSAQGFATSPIRTTSAAVARSADNVSLALAFGSSYSMFGQGIPQGITNSSVNQTILQVDAGSDAQRILLWRPNNGFGYTSVGGTGFDLRPIGTWSQFTRAQIAGAAAAGSQAAVVNGGTVVTGSAATLPTTPTEIDIGSSFAGGGSFNGYVERIAVWPNNRISNAGLNALTGTVH